MHSRDWLDWSCLTLSPWSTEVCLTKGAGLLMPESKGRSNCDHQRVRGDQARIVQTQGTWELRTLRVGRAIMENNLTFGLRDTALEETKPLSLEGT